MNEQDRNKEKLRELLQRSDQWLIREREATLQRIALLQEDLSDVLIALYVKAQKNTDFNRSIEPTKKG
jgi:hypothetical protein